MDFFISLWNRNWVRFAVVSICVIFGLKYIFPLLGPFLPAFLFVVLMNPFFSALQRKTHISKGVLATVFLLVFAIGLTVLLSVIGSGLVSYLQETGVRYREYLTQITVYFQDVLGVLERELGLKQGVLEEGVAYEMKTLWEQLRLTVGKEAMGISYSYLEKGARLLLYVSFLIIGILLLAKDYDSICERLEGWTLRRRIADVFRRLIHMLAVYVKAQGIVLLCISAVSSTGLWVLGVHNPWFWGILAGVLDFFPFIGAGMLLVPLGVLAALFGNFWALPGSVLLFGIVTLVRNILEPKLIGKEMEIYPVLLLFSVFWGIAFYRLGGIVLGPVALFLIKEIYGEIRCK